MKEITAWQTSDGEIFIVKEEAKKHEYNIGLEDWYFNNKLYGNTDGSYVHFDNLIHYLQEHKEKFNFIFGEQK